MTTTARGMLGLVACCIPQHPQARDWAQIAIGEIQHELDTWCDANGGWLEAPHYMTVSMDSIVAVALALRGTGFSETEWAYHPKLKAALAWLAKISTPPDPRLNGDRHMPEIGNTYLGERTCLAGWAAWIWRDRDPAYARNMQWMWKAHGRPRTLGIGGAYPGLQGYASVVLDESIPAAAAAWTSELFPDTGAVLRAHFPGDRETYLHYIQGRMHQHYDYDEGSFILWGKGQPLCEDFGYYGRAPAADHSRVDDGFAEELGNEGQIQRVRRRGRGLPPRPAGRLAPADPVRQRRRPAGPQLLCPPRQRLVRPRGRLAGVDRDRRGAGRVGQSRAGQGTICRRPGGVLRRGDRTRSRSPSRSPAAAAPAALPRRRPRSAACS